MKISDLIKQLEEMKSYHGDREVVGTTSHREKDGEICVWERYFYDEKGNETSRVESIVIHVDY